jgi:4-phospho-D-threonate 3-dehydrogenase / 4-phospho-D-erythronate 3-dehydrogenase
MKNSQPLLAITMGDPAGIGPEITLKALRALSDMQLCRIFVIGDIWPLQSAADSLGITEKLYVIDSAEAVMPERMNVMDMNIINSGNKVIIGKVQADCGNAAYEYIIKAIGLAMAGSVDAIVTCPINKEALKMAGINYPGHTEILADKTGTSDFSMMFACDNVSVVHVTTHVSLKNAITMITQERILSHIRLLNMALKNLGITSPRIAVSGLNPHAGENGLFGDEEIIHIAPAVESAKKEGLNASGPYPPDTVFMRAFKGEFDGIVSMLHDHGFVALKSRDFGSGVNITLGLPIIRTSVGHGTAFDIAGKNIASEKSLMAAVNAAVKMVANRTNQAIEIA